ncbi:MAG: H(+)-transporting V0 sector ATPase subunit d, partial [Paramarteilia canceri]
FYRRLLKAYYIDHDNENISVFEDLVKAAELSMFKKTFKSIQDGAKIYSYFKMKENEIKNINYIIECVDSGVFDIADDVVNF